MDAGYKTLSLCEGAELILFADGTYTLRNTGLPEKSLDISALSLIQCYSNGCINKVPVEKLIALRFNYRYSRGFYPKVKLLATSIVSAEDSIYVKYVSNGVENTTSIKVREVRSHSMLGLKGTEIIGVPFDEVTGWFLNGKLISNQSSITKPQESNEYTVLENIEPDAPNGLLYKSDVEKISNLEAVFRQYLKKDKKDILEGQKHAKEVLAHCQTKEVFWNVIKILFKCNVKIYRPPVVAFLNENDISIFMPSARTLSFIYVQLFSDAAKLEENIEFLYHFKDIVTDEIKYDIARRFKSFPQPELYYKLCKILGMNTNEIIEYCIKQSNAASYYCVYVTLLIVYKKKGYSAVSKLIAAHIQHLDTTSKEGKVIKRLIYTAFKKDNGNSHAQTAKIRVYDYNDYKSMCGSYTEKKREKTKTNHGSLASYVGKEVRGKCIDIYSNHYYLTINNEAKILLPKSLSTKVLRAGDSANVQIVFLDKKYFTLFATQENPVNKAEITKIPLLNNGDIIEISFGSLRDPIPHKCYKKIKVSLESYPKVINQKIRYKAIVIRQTTNRYHYLVKIVM